MMDREFKPPTPNLWSVLSLLAVLGWALPVQAQSEPALQFTSPTVFQVHPEVTMRPWDYPLTNDWEVGIKTYHFDALTAQQSAADELTFTVEGQAGAEREYCFESHCGAVSVAVAASGGHLYFAVAIDAPRSGNGRVNSGKATHMKSNFEDFAPRRVEVAVQAGSQKVYQEVVVDAPADAPDCSDYPTRNEDRFRCYYTREYEAAAFREPASELIASLPGQLVQDREQYEVVFAEEFTGSYTPAAEWEDHCDRGLADLDGGKWNYRHKRCRTDYPSLPCQYLEDGHLHVVLKPQCGDGIFTSGLFEPRYGYMEVSYTLQTTRPPRSSITQFQNFNIVLGDPRRPGKHLLHTHDLEINSLERLLTLVTWLEYDFFEYNPDSSNMVSHQYRNWLHVHHPAVPPLRTNKKREFCKGSTSEGGVLRYQPPNCGNTAARITITEGMEWTPEGYLFLRRVHGLDDTLTTLDKSGTVIQAATWANNSWLINGDNRRLVSGTERAAYFVELDPNNPTFYLETLGISHAPSKIGVGTWGWDFDSELRNRVGMTVDYIRVFQPRNRYADMEPRYQ